MICENVRSPPTCEIVLLSSPLFEAPLLLLTVLGLPRLLTVPSSCDLALGAGITSYTAGWRHEI